MLNRYKEYLEFDYDFYSEIFRSLWGLSIEELEVKIADGNRKCYVPACTCYQVDAFHSLMVQAAIEAGEPYPEKRPHVCEGCQFLEGERCRIAQDATRRCEYFEATGE